MISQRYAVGLLFILMVNVLWVLDPYLIMSVEDDGVDPVFISYIGGVSFSFCLLVAAKDEEKESHHMTARAVLWMGQSVLNTLSLSLTSLTEYSILNTTVGLFCMFFCARWGLEDTGDGLRGRILGGLLTVAGSGIATLGDSTQGGKDATNAAIGDVLCVLSNVLFGAYLAALKIGNLCERKPLRYFGLLGANVAALFAAPIAAYLALSTLVFGRHKGSPWHVVAQKTGFAKVNGYGRDFAIVFAKSLFATGSAEFACAQAALRTSPTVASVGTALTIPLAFLVDVFITHDAPLNDSRAISLQIAGGPHRRRRLHHHLYGL